MRIEDREKFDLTLEGSYGTFCLGEKNRARYSKFRNLLPKNASFQSFFLRGISGFSGFL